MPAQIHPAVGEETDALGFQQSALDVDSTKGPAAGELAAAVDDPMGGDTQAVGGAKECPAYFAGPVRLAQHAGNSAVGGDMSGGDEGHPLVDSQPEADSL